MRCAVTITLQNLTSVCDTTTTLLKTGSTENKGSEILHPGWDQTPWLP